MNAITQKTHFSLAPLPVTFPDGATRTFWFDGNSKITRSNGTFAAPRPNAFSLLHVADCPAATPICKSACYVHRLEASEWNVYEKYRINSAAIREAEQDAEALFFLIIPFAAWIRENCAGGFRWHVSGDIFSEKYARFIRWVCACAREVPFWIYTRSFQFVPMLAHSPNLVVNLSADRDNWAWALDLHWQYGLRICYMTVDGAVPDLPDGSVIFPSHELRGRGLERPTDAPWWQSLSPRLRRMVCPPDFFGQSEHLRCGPCRKCLVPWRAT